jgi:hypothetical protein
VAENQTAVTDVQSTDPDGTTEGAGGLTYSLTGGTDQAKFGIVANTGVLTFIAAPNYENPTDAGANNVYDVQVKVTDPGGLTDVQTIAVTVTNINDAPVITSNGGGATALINVAENQTAVTTVTASDEDLPAQTLTFSITGGADQSLFSIVPSTGVLTFKAAPNFEAPADAGADNVYDVKVTVTDPGGLTDGQDIAVTVTNVNEAPTITSGGGGTSASLNAAENQTVVTDVQSTDPDGTPEGAGADELTYSLTGGADQGRFNIDANAGILKFAVAPDYENPTDANTDNVYDVQVTVTDPGGLTDAQSITVTVTNVNEPPTITSDGGGESASITVQENKTAVTDVQSTDPDGTTEGPGGLTYSLGGTDQGAFSIDVNTGVLTFNPAPNFENPTDSGADNVYDVQVIVTDPGGLTDSQDIAVTVTNVNDPPVVTVPANQQHKEGTTVTLNVIATDQDGHSLTYSANGLPDGLSIDSSTGVISGKIAYTASGVHAVTVTVTDSATPPSSTSVVFTWTVADAYIDQLTGREVHAGTATSNSVTSVNMSYPEIWIASANTVRLLLATPASLPDNKADILYYVTGGSQFGTFSSTPEITPLTGVVTYVSVGIDINGNGTLEGSESTHSVAINVISLTGTKFFSQRSAGAHAELTAFEIRYQEHFEVGGTFDFTMNGVLAGPSPSPRIRYELRDQDFVNNLLQEGSGLSFTYTFQNGVDEGDVFIRLYVDTNNDGDRNSGEDYIDWV